MTNNAIDNSKSCCSAAHNDPITGTAGAHPIGVGVGAVTAGAAAGAVGGVAGGPIGAVAGAIAGAVLGGLAGKATAEDINPTHEGSYWRDNYASRPYVMASYSYGEYEPAYRYGWESFGRYSGENHPFASFEAEMSRGWNAVRGTSTLLWAQAREASKDAWERVQHATLLTRKSGGR